jgi:hypothetical protein
VEGGEDEETETEGEVEEEGGGDESEDGKTPARDAEGKFVASGEKGKAGEGAAKPDAGAKLGADGKPVAEPKKADPVNDPIPDDVKGRTRQRMTELIDTVKSKDEIITNQNTVIQAVRNTGASPEEFAAMVSYMGLSRSESRESLTQARDMLLEELESIALKLGEPVPGIDPLAKHPELRAKVEAGQITLEDAQELALSRTGKQKQTETTEASRAQDAAAQRATQERNAAIAELDKLGKELLATDPDFAAKHAVLEPVLQSLGMLPPKQWKAAFQAAYKAVKLPETPAAPVNGQKPAATPPAKGAPLRANKSPSGGQNRQPTSLLDAVSAAVDEVGQR